MLLSHFKLTFDIACVFFVCFAFKNPCDCCKHATLQASVPVSCDSSPLDNGRMKGQHRDLFVWQLLLTATASSASSRFLQFFVVAVSTPRTQGGLALCCCLTITVKLSLDILLSVYSLVLPNGWFFLLPHFTSDRFPLLHSRLVTL